MANYPLKAGAAAVDITPQMQVALAGHFKRRDSEGILDPLHARAIVLDNGHNRLAFVLLDLINFTEPDCTLVRQQIADVLDMPIDNVCVSCTHTHTGPATRPGFDTPRQVEYLDWAMPRMVQAARAAADALVPAEAAWGIGHEARPQYNRRFHMHDGSVRMNPGAPDDIVRPAGPTDPELPMLLLRRAEDGKALAVLANYSLHYIGDFSSKMVSSDYFGEFSRLAAERLGETCVALLTHGASGDINNVNHQKLPTPWYPEKMEPKDRSKLIAGWLLDQVQQVWDKADWRQDVILDSMQQIYELPTRPLNEDEIKEAQRDAQDQNLTEVQRYYARNWLKLLDSPRTLPQVVSTLRVGDWAAATMTGEIFCQYGIDLKYASPFAVTALIELANGHMGYTPTRYSFVLGGYETWHSGHAFGDYNCGHEMVAMAARGLRELWLKKNTTKIEAANKRSFGP